MYKVLKLLFIFSFWLYSSPSYAQSVCFSDSQAVDIITLLDSSERDLNALTDCKELVRDLNNEVKYRGEKIKSLTNDIIKANQKVISYQTKYEQAKKVAWYSGITAVVAVAVTVVQAVL